MSSDTVRAIIDAVAVDGFKARLIGSGLELHGEISFGKTPVPMQIRFEDLTLASSPRCFLPDVSMLPRKVVPHLDGAGEFCVVDRSMFVFDRYRAPEQTRGLIVRAREVLERGMTKAGTDEIAQEFLSYWTDTWIDRPADPAVAGGAAISLNLATVSTAATLSFDAHQSKPSTLGELLEWAAFWDNSLEAKILAALGRLTPHDPMVEIQAANTAVIARLTVSARGSTYLQTLLRPKGWQRFVKTPAARSLTIERLEGQRTDLARILGMNGPEGTAPLAGRKVVLIGCGAIGGYLARMLVQSGAGMGATLTLIDPDRLGPKNLRRHQLGVGDLRRVKAEACADAIGRDFPGTDIVPLSGQAQHHEASLDSADLVIDATGEQEFGDWLNQWALERRTTGPGAPALLFVWIAGHGAAAQSFLVIGDAFACYRCLQPRLDERGRFDPLKDPVAEPVAPCGEQPFTRYGPAASAAAASLASSHANDWAVGHPHQLLRTVRIDWEATVKRDPKSPDKAANCPACGG